MPRGVGRHILYTMRKRIILYALLGLTVLPVSAQKNKNYFTQVLRLNDGTEMRILADDIQSISAMHTDDYQNMTAWEFIKFAKADIDSASLAYQRIYPNDLSVPFTSLYGQYTVMVPNNNLWRTVFPLMEPYCKSAPSTAYYDLNSFISATDTRTAYEYGRSTEGTTAANIIETSWNVDYTNVAITLPVCNGNIAILDKLPKESWLKDFTLSPNNLSTAITFPNLVSKKIKTTSEDMTYIHFIPSGERSKPDIHFFLPKVLSTTYDFYCVVVPQNPSIATDATDTRPNWLNFELNYSENGQMKKYYFSKAYADSLQTGGALPAVPTRINTTTAFTNNTSKVDTVYIGRFTFPNAYVCTQNACPSLRITSPISVFNKTQMETYTRDVRLAAIIMRPIELNGQASH